MCHVRTRNDDCNMKKQMQVDLIFIHSIIWISTAIITECLNTEEVVWRCFEEKVFSGISQNSQENTCARVSFLIKLQAEVKLENMSYYYIPFTSTFN